MPKIVIAEMMEIDAVDSLKEQFDVFYDEKLFEDKDALRSALKGASALIVRNLTQVNKEILADAPGVTVVGRLGVGLDNIDLDYCAARKIDVIPATGANEASVIEYVLSQAFALLRPVHQHQPALMQGHWPRKQAVGFELNGKVLGLLGLGSISRKLAQKAMCLDMQVVAFDPYVSIHEPAWEGIGHFDFEELMQTADIISLHVPLTDSTRNLINADALKLVKKSAVLINTSRGSVVDEAALVRALKEGRLAGAALDVFEQEPLSADQAKLFEEVPNLILTPHVAGLTHESMQRVSSMIAQKLTSHLQSRRG